MESNSVFSMARLLPLVVVGWLLLLGPSDAAQGTECFVLCDTSSGQIQVGEWSADSPLQKLAGPFPGRRTAGFWLDENCPSHRCGRGEACGSVQPEPPQERKWLAVCNTILGQTDVAAAPLAPGMKILVANDQMAAPTPDRAAATLWASHACPSRTCDELGRCFASPAPPEPGSSWIVGDLTSETLGSSSGAATAHSPQLSMEGPEGPGAADLSPLMNNAIAAAEGCNFPVALASANHMTEFDPAHPWLQANHRRLMDLARRQNTTEQLVWQASAELSNGELKRAKKLASSAADSALSCQTQAVAQLVRGIDTAIEQRSRQRQASTAQAMAALLPSLVDMANVISGGTASGSTPTPSASSYSSNPAATLNMGDPCAFKYEYRNKWNFEPFCTCLGYQFDMRQHRCVRVTP